MTDFERMNRISAELEKARARLSEAEAQVKELEKKYREAENVTIHNLVHGANMTPEQLAALIGMNTGEKLSSMNGKNNSKNNQNENTDNGKDEDDEEISI